jgi:hypothetical protein
MCGHGLLVEHLCYKYVFTKRLIPAGHFEERSSHSGYSICSADTEGYFKYKLRKGETLLALSKKYLGARSRWCELIDSKGCAISEEMAKKLQVGTIVQIPDEG